MNAGVVATFGLILMLSGCNQGGQIVHISKADTNGANAMPDGAGPNATPGLVDVVVILAVSNSATQLQSKINSGVADLTKDLSTGVGSGLKVALVGRGASNILQNPEAGLSSANAKAIEAQIDPGNALVGALAAGCAKTLTSFLDSKNSPANPVVCSQNLSSVAGNTAEILGQSSLATLEPIKESLVGFLRPATRRAYVFITDGDAEYLDGETLTTIVKAQNGGNPGVVFALAPTVNGANGDCAANSKTSERYPDVTHDTGGANYSYCDKDWSTSVHAIVASIVKLK